MSIITVSREFGSGGREVGKRLADALGYAYYDREIVAAIAAKTKLEEGYVASALEGGMFRNIPIHFGRTFSYSAAVLGSTTNLFVEQHKILKELAEKGADHLMHKTPPAQHPEEPEVSGDAPADDGKNT